MVFRTLTLLCCLSSLQVPGQVLRDMNYNFRYDPSLEFSFQWKVIRQNEGYDVYYTLQLTDSSQLMEQYHIQWELRNSLGDKTGLTITTPIPNIIEERSWKQVGKLHFSLDDPRQKILLAKIIHTTKKQWLHYTQLPQQQSPYLSGSKVSTESSYINKNYPVKISGFDSKKSLHISYYPDPFPAAAPVFSTTQARVTMRIKPDSTFNWNGSSTINFTEKGLYLAQVDTTSSHGLAFRVEEDYPKLGTLQSLVGPLVYICTKDEYEKLSTSDGDKKKFDQVILTITGNPERARTFMRSYFKRVELANVYFSSYKEGWKTDRGMVYIIFGLPEEVYLFEDREVWEYRNENAKLRFQFIKSATLFDPDNYVLIRDKKFTATWYKMIDLWRKARF